MSRYKIPAVTKNFIDRAFDYVAPTLGARRMRARLAMSLANGYTGASKSRDQTRQWNIKGGDADQLLNADLPTLRDRSMDLFRNNPLARGVINTNVTSIVGAGLALNCQIDRRLLGMDDQQADDWEENTEREFNSWANSANCDMTRQMNFGDIQRLAFMTTLGKGDVFVNMPFKKRPGSPYGLKLQLITPERVCNEGNAPDSLQLSGGVEKDLDGAPLNYHVLNTHPDRYDSKVTREWQKVKAFGSKTGRRNILHLHEKKEVGQTRTPPYLTPVIETLRMIGLYTEYELQAAAVSGLFTVFIKTEGGADGLNLNPEGTDASTTPDNNFKMGGGKILDLANGESVETANPGRPNTAFDGFVLSILRQIGVGLEIPYEILIKHFTSSYSASRAAILEAWRFYTTRRKWLATNLCDPVFEAFMWQAVSMGRIHAPGFFDDPIIRAAYLGTQWIGPAKGQLDELKETLAAKEKMQLGSLTHQMFTQETNGTDWGRNVERLGSENKKKAGKGLPPLNPNDPELLKDLLEEKDNEAD